jgi:chemotaxis protein CheD
MRRAGGITDVVLMPGEFFVGGAGYRPSTLLGSCVSVTLWHRVRRIGAMSHFLLSTRGCADAGLDGRYGDEAIFLMLKELTRHGVAPPECEAKIFGGASMQAGGLADSLQVGQKNGDIAQRILRELGIPVVSESLFGQGHRNIIFDIASGYVWARQVKPMSVALPQARSTA